MDLLSKLTPLGSSSRCGERHRSNSMAQRMISLRTVGFSALENVEGTVTTLIALIVGPSFLCSSHVVGVAAVAVLGVILVLVVVLEAEGVARRRKLRHIPGPPGWPILGHIPYLTKEPWKRFAQFSNDYGSLYKLWIWRKLFVVVSDPELVKRIFVTERTIYPKDDWSYKYFEWVTAAPYRSGVCLRQSRSRHPPSLFRYRRDILGHGIVTSEGAHWKQQRALLSPAFHFGALERLQPLFEKAAARLIDSLQEACNAAPGAAPSTHSRGSGGGFSRTEEEWVRPLGSGAAEMELSSTFRKVTLEVISEVALSLKPESASVFPALFEAVLDELNQRMFQPWRAFMPLQLAHRKRLNKLNAIVAEIIDARKALRAADPARYAGKAMAAPLPSSATAELEDDIGAGGNGSSSSGPALFAGGGDMLDLMLDSGVPLTDAQLSDEVKTQLLAGHETSSMMLTWAVFLLARHPEQLAKAVAEADSLLGLEPGVTRSAVPHAKTNASPSFEDFKSCEILGWVLKEAMRLYSPVPVLTRESTAEDTLGGFRVPAGTALIISVWALHLSPSVWGPTVAEFRPERFSPEESRGRHAFAYLPFSLGPRNCIGQNLAIMEAKVILGALLRRFTLRLAPGTPTDPPTDCYVIPVRPEQRLHVILERRK